LAPLDTGGAAGLGEYPFRVLVVLLAVGVAGLALTWGVRAIEVLRTGSGDDVTT
jgi:hypothetical protein